MRMKLLRLGLFVIIATFLGRGSFLSAQDLAPNKVIEGGLSWEIDTLRVGLDWKAGKFDTLYQSRQSINILTLSNTATSLAIRVAFVDSQRLFLSSWSQSLKAIASINASFFDMTHGGGVCYLQVDDTVRNPSKLNLRNYLDEGGICFGEKGEIEILSRPDSGWKYDPICKDLISSGPILLFRDSIADFSNDPFHQKRHPRTGLGIRSDGTVLLVTVDGRNAQAQGMSIPEFAHFFKKMGCKDAINLDGGGSTAMFLAGYFQDGIVSYPSDNKGYDHQGERKISSIIYVK